MMSTSSKSRIMLAGLILAIILWVALPGIKPVFRLVICVSSAFLVWNGFCGLAEYNTVDLRGKLLICSWNMEEDCLQIMYKEKDAGKHDKNDEDQEILYVSRADKQEKAICMNCYHFSSDSSKLVMDEDGVMVIKRKGLRLLVPETLIIRRFYAA